MKHAFTLIELLVVVTIIVILLALLMPAMDKAIYQAEMTQCMGNLKVITGGFNVYALGNGRRYPERNLAKQKNIYGVAPYMITNPTEGPGVPPGYDLRPMLRDLFPINKALNDPMTQQVDMEYQAPAPDHYVMATYYLFFGWKYEIPDKGGAGMNKIGDRWVYDRQRFSLLASDFDFHRDHETRAISSHNDFQTMDNLVQDYEPSIFGGYITFSYWRNPGSAFRKPLDLNFAYADGSVRRFSQVIYTRTKSDERMARVPNVFDVENNAKAYVPRE